MAKYTLNQPKNTMALYLEADYQNNPDRDVVETNLPAGHPDMSSGIKILTTNNFNFLASLENKEIYGGGANVWINCAYNDKEMCKGLKTSCHDGTLRCIPNPEVAKKKRERRILASQLGSGRRMLGTTVQCDTLTDT